MTRLVTLLSLLQFFLLLCRRSLRDKFRTDFIQAGLTQFGSGWAWLVLSGGAGKIVKTPNAETPLTTTDVPLLVCDVWEHAYYLDHRNNRKGFLEAFCDKLLNWDFVAKNLAAAK